MKAADVAAIAMIRNNGVWIHRLIKTLSSKLNGQHWPFLRLRSRNDRPKAARPGACPEKTCQHLNFRCDLIRDAAKTTRLGAMNTDRIMIPRSKLRKYCHGQLCQLSRMSIHSWLFMHDRVNQGEMGSTVLNFQNGGCWDPCGR